jgi:hypothetical protein
MDGERWIKETLSSYSSKECKIDERWEDAIKAVSAYNKISRSLLRGRQLWQMVEVF